MASDRTTFASSPPPAAVAAAHLPSSVSSGAAWSEQKQPLCILLRTMLRVLARGAPKDTLFHSLFDFALIPDMSLVMKANRQFYNFTI